MYHLPVRTAVIPILRMGPAGRNVKVRLHKQTRQVQCVRHKLFVLLKFLMHKRPGAQVAGSCFNSPCYQDCLSTDQYYQPDERHDQVLGQGGTPIGVERLVASLCVSYSLLTAPGKHFACRCFARRTDKEFAVKRLSVADQKGCSDLVTTRCYFAGRQAQGPTRSNSRTRCQANRRNILDLGVSLLGLMNTCD